MNHVHATAKMTASLARMCAFLLALLAFLVIIGALVSADAQSSRPPHRRRLRNNLQAEMRNAVRLVEAQPSRNARRSNIARNRTGSYVAFTLEVPIEGADGNAREVIFIENKRQGKFYEVRGFDFPRPFANLEWKGNHTLVLDQWMQPHYAVHYVINVRQKRLVSAQPFRERGDAP